MTLSLDNSGLTDYSLAVANVLDFTFASPGREQSLVAFSGNADPVDEIDLVPPAEVLLLDIEYEGRFFALRNGLEVEIGADGPYVTARARALGIVTSGCDVDEAIAGVEMEFVAIWDHLVDEQPARLTGDALALRRKIRRLVHHVSP